MSLELQGDTNRGFNGWFQLGCGQIYISVFRIKGGWECSIQNRRSGRVEEFYRMQSQEHTDTEKIKEWAEKCFISWLQYKRAKYQIALVRLGAE